MYHNDKKKNVKMNHNDSKDVCPLFGVFFIWSVPLAEVLLYVCITSSPIAVGDSASALLVSMGSGASLEDFYPSIAINSLMRILRDQSLSQHHTMAIQV